MHTLNGFASNVTISRPISVILSLLNFRFNILAVLFMQPLPSPLSARKVPTHRFTAKTVRVHRQQRALQNRKRTHLKFNPPHLILMPRTVWKHLYYTESTVPSKFRIDERHTDGLGHFGSHFACIFVGLHWCCSNLRRSHYLLSVIFFFPENRINQMWNVQN